MKLRVSDEIARKFPELRISFLTIRGMDNTGPAPALEAELREAEARLRTRFPELVQLEETPAIAGWREVYRSFNVNPKRFRPSAEALLRRIVKGDPVSWISKAVNAYLLAELEYLLPVGGYDLAGLQGDIVLRTSAGGEPFLAIGSETPEPTEAGEIVYADEAKVLTRRWNFRDCDQTKVTETSRDVALFVEGPLPSMTTEDLMGLAERIAAGIRTHCGGEVKTGLLDVSVARELTLP